MTFAESQSRRRSLSQGEIDELVAELRALDREAHSTGRRTGKDMRAARALALTGALVESLAGWAIDHHVGLAVNNVLYEPMDLAPAFGADADDDRHETAGADYDWSNASINRRALTNLLAANPGAIPYLLALETALGLEALDLDETRPIFERRKRSLDHTPYMIAQLRLRAVEHVIFFERAENDRAAAEEKVAAAFGVSTEALRQWEMRLPYLLGNRPVSESYSRAAEAGVTARRLGLPLCRAEVRKRDEQLSSDATRHAAACRQLRPRKRR
ncbi:MAG: hypothetical protein ACE5H8_15925 [Alphaproteobacteria bacterium]